jgi:hypothetical protein
VPDEIYNIPPSDPLYPMTYVEVYDSTPDEVVTGYTAGYLGSYICDDAVVYGTGYYYPPYVGDWYWGYPCTWGTGVWYNPWSAGFVYRNSFYTPYAHAFVRAGYNPISGWYGAGYTMNTPYSSWGRGVVGRGDQWLRGGYYAGPGGGVAGIAGSGGGKAGVAVGPGGSVIKGATGPGGRGTGTINRGGDGTRVVRGNDNLYVGHDGNVYRRNDNGTWQKRENGQWAGPAGQAARQAVNRAGFNQPSLNRPAGELRQEWQMRPPVTTRPGASQTAGQRSMNTIPQHNVQRAANVPRPAPQAQRPNINLNSEQQMRQQGQQRAQSFQQARPQIQQARPQVNRAPAGFNRGMRGAGGGGGRGGRR